MKRIILIILALLIVSEVSNSSGLNERASYITISTKTVLVRKKIGQQRIKKAIESGTIHDSIRLQYLTVAQFKKRLRFHESLNNYSIVNGYGFSGAYQFSPYMIRRFGCVSQKVFLQTPSIQENVMSIVCAFYLSYIYRNGYDKYVGLEIAGVTITLEALMLGVHFSPLYLKNWLETQGTDNRCDANISIGAYMKKFEHLGEQKTIIIARKNI